MHSSLPATGAYIVDMDKYIVLAQEVYKKPHATAGCKPWEGTTLGHFNVTKWHSGNCGCLILYEGSNYWFVVARVILHQGKWLTHTEPISKEDGVLFMATCLRDLDSHTDVFDMFLAQFFCTHLFPEGMQRFP